MVYINNMNFFSCDPGQTGFLVLWENNKIIEYKKFNELDYLNLFRKHPNTKLVIEFIAAVMNGAYASFILGKNIGFIKGLAFANNIEIIEKGNTPIEWKSVWKKQLVKPKKVKWKPDEAKKRDIALCQELYPEINLLLPELDEKGNIKTYKKNNKKKGIKIGDPILKLQDGLADAILIGRSAIERKIITF